MKKLAIALLLSNALITTANADTIGFEIGASAWADSQTITPQHATEQKTKSDVAGSVYALLEHPVPFLPNVRAEYLNNKNTIRRSKDSSETSYVDLTLYYQLLDNWVNIDLGVTGRRMDAEKKGIGFSHKSDQTLAALYLAARFDLPLTGLSLGASATHDGSISSSKGLQDYNAYLRYQASLGFGVQAGYRLQKYLLKYDNNAGKANIDVAGAYVQAFWKF